MQISIEKLVYGGDGLGREKQADDARAKAVFIPFVLPGEVVDATIVEEKKGFARARLERLVAESPERIEPKCPYFGRCGGCHYQHTSYEHQLQIKREILRETLRRTAKIELDVEIEAHASEPWNFRNRTRMKVSALPEFAVGYFRYGTHDLLPVRECPISSPLINRALDSMWALGGEGAVPRELQEVQWFANDRDDELLVELYFARGTRLNKFDGFVRQFRDAVPQAKAVVAFETVRGSDDESDRGPLVSSRSGPSYAYGASALQYRVGDDSYRVSAGAFFQTNRFMTDELLRLVVPNEGGTRAVDFYAGVGLFSLPLARRFKQVTAVEVSGYSAENLRENVPANVETVQKTTEDFLKQSGRVRADLIVVDPPRAGLGENVSQMLGRTSAPRVTYVSCDPATLSRDLATLIKSGYRVEQAHLIDLFPQTFHIESVFHLIR